MLGLEGRVGGLSRTESVKRKCVLTGKSEKVPRASSRSAESFARPSTSSAAKIFRFSISSLYTHRERERAVGDISKCRAHYHVFQSVIKVRSVHALGRKDATDESGE